jgi:23S rRNA (guanosine2251-2'-O)-methyltransferase
MIKHSGFWIGGKHSVEAAILKKKRKIIQVVALKKNKFLDDHCNNYEIKNEKFFNKIFYPSHIAHQGIAALVSPLPKVSLDEIIQEKNIVLLDGITDPMNIGSIIRNCAAFNIQSIIVQDREFNEKSSAMIKASSGAIEIVKICKVSNLSSTIKHLKTKNFFVTCLDGKANQNIHNSKWEDKNLVIFGSEGDGVSNLIKKNSDQSLQIKIHQNIESLNVSNAVAITLFSLYNK